MWVFCLYVCYYMKYVEPVIARREHRMPRNCSYRLLWATMWGLGIKSRWALQPLFFFPGFLYVALAGIKGMCHHQPAKEVENFLGMEERQSLIT